MVHSTSARLDSDNLFFNGDKTALYHQVSETEDLTYGSKTLTYTTVTLAMQGNVLTSFDKFVRQGLLSDGDAVGVLRYEYTEEADGTAISPTLIPKKHDEITLAGRRFRLDKLNPQMGEDHLVILFTFNAVPTSQNDDLVFPYTFPLQF